MSTTQETRFFIKQNGRVKGPYPVSSLMSMQQRRKIDRETLVSEDRREGWVQAESLEDVFPENLWERKTPVTNEEKQWYYSVDEERMGPYSFDEMAQFAATGVVSEYDHVISETMTDWVEASQIDGLIFVLPEQTASAKNSLRKHIGIAVAICFMVMIVPAVGYLVKDHLRIKENERLAMIDEQEKREEEQKILDEMKKDKVRLEEKEEREKDRKSKENVAKIKAAGSGFGLTGLLLAELIAKSEKKKASNSGFNSKYKVGDFVGSGSGLTGLLNGKNWRGTVISVQSSNLYRIKISGSGPSSEYVEGKTYNFRDDEIEGYGKK